MHPEKFRDMMQQVADEYEQRHKVYGDNYMHIGSIINSLSKVKSAPDQELIHQLELSQVHLIGMVTGKLGRFINSGSVHLDSVHDMITYCALLEHVTLEMLLHKNKKINEEKVDKPSTKGDGIVKGDGVDSEPEKNPTASTGMGGKLRNTQEHNFSALKHDLESGKYKNPDPA